MTHPEVEFRFSAAQTTTEELVVLFAVAGLGGRKGDKIRRAFVNSPVVCLAYVGNRLVGASRAITDGEYHAVIYDVAVDPEFQQQGLGTRMMEELVARLPVWRVMLIAGDDVQPFYGRLGFESYPGAMARLDGTRLYDPEPADAP